MNPAPATDPASALESLAALVGELIERNRTLVAECDSLYEHIEVITQRLSTREADILSLKQNTTAPEALLHEERERDQRRLTRLRAELDAYLSEIDARTQGREAQRQEAPSRDAHV